MFDWTLVRRRNIRPGALTKIGGELTFLPSIRPITISSRVSRPFLCLAVWICAASAIFDDADNGLVCEPLSSIIPCAVRVKNISAAEVIDYNEGITGSHFDVGGIEWIIIPLHVSSVIAGVLVRVSPRFVSNVM